MPKRDRPLQPLRGIPAALLHQLDHGLLTLRAAGVSENVIRAVMALTKHPGQEYDEYIKKVKKNPMARKVKIADMINNLCDMPTSAQIEKYNRGLKALLA